jgi:hypothetical protein
VQLDLREQPLCGFTRGFLELDQRGGVEASETHLVPERPNPALTPLAATKSVKFLDFGSHVRNEPHSVGSILTFEDPRVLIRL